MGDRTVFGQDLKSMLSGSINDLPTSSIDIPLTVLDEEIEYDQPTFICELRIEQHITGKRRTYDRVRIIRTSKIASECNALTSARCWQPMYSDKSSVVSIARSSDSGIRICRTSVAAEPVGRGECHLTM